MAEYTEDIGRIATALERIASSLDHFKNNGVISKSPTEELNSLSLAKSILGQGSSLTDAVKSGKAIQDAIKDLVTDPNNTSKKIPSPPKTLVLKGVWNSSQTYAKEEMVSYKDSIWLCLRDNSGIVPEHDPSYWIQPSSNDIKNIQTAPALPKIANNIDSTTPEEGEVVYVQSVQGIQTVQAIQATKKKKGVQGVQGIQGIQGGFFIGKKDGNKVPLTDSAFNDVEGIPTAKNVGTWSGKKQYHKNDVVSNNNKLWVAEIDPPAGIAPSEDNGWYPTEKVDELPTFAPPVDLPDPPPPPPPPVYAVTPSAVIVDEGSNLTFIVDGSNIEDGTYYWTTERIGGNLNLNSTLPVTLRNGLNVKIDVIDNGLSITLRNSSIVNFAINNNSIPVTLHNGGNSIPVGLIDGSSITYVSIRELGNGVGASLSITLHDSSIVNTSINNNLLSVTLYNGSIVDVTIIDNQLPVQKIDIGLTYYVNINGVIGNVGPGIPITLHSGINTKADITNNRLSITLRNGNVIDLIIDGGNSVKNVEITDNGNFGNSSGTFDIIDNLGSFTIMPTADLTTEGNEKFTVSIRSSSAAGVLLATSEAVTINDTSLTPVPPHTTWNASVYYLKEEIVEFCGLFYKAKVNTFRTIPSRSPNDWERRYY